jgi:hypothetical protein
VFYFLKQDLKGSVNHEEKAGYSTFDRGIHGSGDNRKRLLCSAGFCGEQGRKRR